MIKVDIIPILQDNYVYIIRNTNDPFVVAVDPGQAQPVIDWLDRNDLSLTHILNTHHHADHIGGNKKLKRIYDCQIIGPKSEEQRINNMDKMVVEGDVVNIGTMGFHVLEVPGHTTGHIIFWAADAELVFVGDSLFSMGCGRMFEGTPEQMWHSLKKIRDLPDQTLVYPTHEYTLENGRFAMVVDANNDDLKTYMNIVREKRSENLPSLPTSIAQEKKVNPFLRADVPSVQSFLGMEGQSAVDVFAELRQRKDVF